MRDVIVISNATYSTIAGVWEATSLPAGAILFVDQAGTALAGDATTFVGDYVNILSKKTNLIKTSFPILRGSRTKVTKSTVTAAVAAVKCLGSTVAAGSPNYSLNYPATLTVGSVVGVGVIDLSLPTDDNRRYKEYEHTVVSGDVMTGDGASNVITKLIARINADTNKVVNVAANKDGSANITGIKFTAKTAGKDFMIYRFGDVLQNADICEYKVVNGASVPSLTAVVVANNPGQGLGVDITEELNATESRDGDSNYRTDGELYNSEPSNAVLATSYVTYVVTTEVMNNDPINKQNYPNLDMMVAVPTGNSTLIGILDVLFALVVA